MFVWSNELCLFFWQTDSQHHIKSHGLSHSHFMCAGRQGNTFGNIVYVCIFKCMLKNISVNRHTLINKKLEINLHNSECFSVLGLFHLKSVPAACSRDPPPMCQEAATDMTRAITSWSGAGHALCLARLPCELNAVKITIFLSLCCYGAS